MVTPEFSRNPEAELSRVDALIVLGRNFQPGFDRKALAEQRFHLSPQSRINDLAAGLLYEAGFADTLVISTGHTSGSNVPSEAEAMKTHLQSIFKDIPDEAIVLEENSIDTEGNAAEVKKITEQHPEWKDFGLLTDPSHLERAVPLFTQQGMTIKPYDSLAILGAKDSMFVPEFVENYLTSELYQNTIKQDRRAQQLQTLPVVSPITSRLLALAARHMRNPNRVNPHFKG
ncbi:MAG TPA: YdcF family protein [Patescibacteria group bacterium]|nr:YdcF family protein [Patescibacteria group bacterium]